MRVEVSELADALSDGFDPARAEQVHRLLGILRELQSIGDTRDGLTLKGGTALNMFWSDRIPRLSVDLDLMVTGFPAASANSSEMARIIARVDRISRGLGYSVTRSPSDAACTLFLSYRNHLGTEDRIKLDLDFLNRLTLAPAVLRVGPRLFAADDLSYQVVTRSELFGQKLAAVAYRAVERDLYDMWRMLNAGWHEFEGARAMYLAYSLLQDIDWHRLDYPTRLVVDYRRSRLADVLRSAEEAPTLEQVREVAKIGLEGSTPTFTHPTDSEKEIRRRILAGDTLAFADLIREADAGRRASVSAHPALQWRLRQAARSRG